MAEEIIYCPSCNNKVRVPEELLGQGVQCPLCNLSFVTPTRGGTPTILPLERPNLEQDEKPTFAPWLLIVPAICLLVAGGLGMLHSLLTVLNALQLGADGMARQMAPMKEAFPGIMTMDGEALYAVALFYYGPLTAVGLLIVISAIQMLRRRTYGLALAGSIAALINLHPLCCWFSLPFGIWALIMLLRADVRGTFQ